VTALHARVDVIEGRLPEALVGAAAGLSKRAFAVLTLTSEDDTVGVGEAAPLPGYSPESIEDAAEELRVLIDAPIAADASLGPLALLDSVPEVQLSVHPSARFALESALLDWLGKVRGEPIHRLLNPRTVHPVPIADLVLEADPERWPDHVDRLCTDGATHLKLKVGAALDQELAALQTVRRDHPELAIRLDGNRRIDMADLRRHAAQLESLDLELIEEPVAPRDWPGAALLPLPLALDETLDDESISRRLLEEGHIRAVVIKPTVRGGMTGALDLATIAREHGAQPVLSHTFEGPIARAAAAELALAFQTELAAGLGSHPALQLWPPHRIAAIRGRELCSHAVPGLGFKLEEPADA
jgi:o-succinylbenzoate synthase